MTRHADAIVNRWEAQARAVRVSKLLACTPVGTDAAANAEAIAYLEAATPAERALYAAKHAGLKNPPSDATWAQFIDQLRARAFPRNDTGRDPAEAIT